MLPSEQILEQAAQDGTMDIAEWPRVLETLLKRLHDIVHTEFPLPSIPLPTPIPSTIDPEVVASTPPAGISSDLDPKDEDLPDADDENEPPVNSQGSTKENDVPTDTTASRPPVPGFEVNHIAQAMQPPDSVEMQSGTLPPDLLSVYTRSTRTLEHDFAHSPPYTIQRLAELVLYPKKHYRFLPAFIRALDRIVSVSSPLSDFPLPALHSSMHGNFLTNGDSGQANGISEGDGLGSDESLGGALLTPIPWLRPNAAGSMSSQNSHNEGEFRSESTETIEGPNGAGSIETVSVTVNGVPSATSAAHTNANPVSPTLSEQSDASSSSSSGSAEAHLREQGAVTQGELLRQEQEAGVIPMTTSSSPRRSLMSAGAVAVGREQALAGAGTPNVGEPSIEVDKPPEDTPHARGPEEIGMEDVGLQHHADTGLDMEAAVGRGRSKSPQPPEAGVETKATNEHDTGAPGREPADVEKDVERLREMEGVEKEAEARDGDGDVVVADADGMTEVERERKEA